MGDIKETGQEQNFGIVILKSCGPKVLFELSPTSMIELSRENI